MGYKVLLNFEDDVVTASTVNDAEESYVYATVTVKPSDGFERNAVVVVTDFRNDDQCDVDTVGTGFMRDDAARAYSAALAAYYARRDHAARS